MYDIREKEVFCMDKVKIKVRKKDAGMSIKEYLKSMHVGRGKIEELRVLKASLINGTYQPLEYVLKENDELAFAFQEKIDVKPSSSLPLDVIYEDENILIVNKPVGYIVHSDGNDNTPTLSSLVAQYYYEHKIFRPVRYIHRLDKDTSGIVLFAKDFLSEAQLHADMERHLIIREYLGIVTHKMKEKEGTIHLALGRDRHASNKMRVSKTGQDAITHFKVEKEYKGSYSLVRFRLETGRTHQIRVHMAYYNHPLLGDELYGEKSTEMPRVALHSAKITFFHPILKEFITIESPLPEDMKTWEKGHLK